MSRIKFFLIIMLAMGSLPVLATHLVGGEIELIHMEGNKYLIRQNQYFDAHGANTQTIIENELNATVFIFSKKTNLVILQVILTRVFLDKVPYSNPDCDNATLEILKLVYESEVLLSASIFDESEGYYIAWERCCRNDHIVNINNPESTGQAFYMEFPAVVKNGQSFVNSSPTLFPPIGDYACKNQMFYFDFSGSDPDGDSLVYSLATPLDTHTDEALPANVLPSPYPLVSFKTGIGLKNMVPGSPSLGITYDGFITVKPSQTGLFVFAVKCEEYRNGVKIGEVRRDYQLLVVANCNPGSPPEIVMKKGSGPIQSGKVNVVFDKSDADRCINISVSDLDKPETVRLLMRPLNFSDLENLVPDTTAVLFNSSLNVQICFPDCPAFTNEPYKMYILALDDACTFPLIDTLHLEVSYKDFDQQAPHFINEGSNIELIASPGESFQIPIQALDEDGDTISVQLLNSSLPLAAFDASFSFQNKAPGSWNGQFNWTFDCNNPVYDTLTEVTFTLVSLDKNACLTSLSDTLQIKLKINVEENIKPVININGYNESDTLFVFIGETINLVINTTDSNSGNPLNLIIKRDEFDFEELGVSFIDKNGSTSLNSTFQWQVPCGKLNLSIQDIFTFEFTSTDSKTCRLGLSDTLQLFIKLKPLVNASPEIEIFDLPIGDTLLVLSETELIINLSSFDSPEDSVLIYMFDLEQFQSYGNFNPNLQNGMGEANGQIIWTPSCDLLGPNGTSATYKLQFGTSDINICKQSKASQEVFYVTVYNIDNIPSYLPVNAITPNNDPLNQEFYLYNLPADNCINRFENIEILNRWGRTVFYSEDRNFRWDGGDESAGVYFYTIRFTNRTIVSPIHVMR